jgi:hypothetical protein
MNPPITSCNKLEAIPPAGSITGSKFDAADNLSFPIDLIILDLKIFKNLGLEETLILALMEVGMVY